MNQIAQEIILSDTNKVVVSKAVWKGQDRLDIRTHWAQESKDFIPTKKGISVPIDTIIALDLIKGIAKVCGLSSVQIADAINNPSF